MYVCMHACMHACMYVCVRVYVYAHCRRPLSYHMYSGLWRSQPRPSLQDDATRSDAMPSRILGRTVPQFRTVTPRKLPIPRCDEAQVEVALHRIRRKSQANGKNDSDKTNYASIVRLRTVNDHTNDHWKTTAGPHPQTTPNPELSYRITR